jgi:predicted amidohydrolase
MTSRQGLVGRSASARVVLTVLGLAAGAGTAAAGGPLDGPQPTVRVAGVVLKWVRGDKEANFRRAAPLIREATRQGAQVVCTTECFLDGYAIADKGIPLDDSRRLGEPTPGGAYYRRLAALAGELKIHLVAGLLEADGGARSNTAVLIGPDGQLLGKYRKQTLGHESVRNTPGTGSPVFVTPLGKVGLMACADRTDAAIVGRICANGADPLICPSGGMFGPRSNDPVVQARSRENRVPIVFVHPAEFLVTGADGATLDRTILGDTPLIAPDGAGRARDQNRVSLFDLPVRRKPAADPPPRIDVAGQPLAANVRRVLEALDLLGRPGRLPGRPRRLALRRGERVPEPDGRPELRPGARRRAA